VLGGVEISLHVQLTNQYLDHRDTHHTYLCDVRRRWVYGLDKV